MNLRLPHFALPHFALALCVPAALAAADDASFAILVDGTNALPNALFSGADAGAINALSPNGFSQVAYNVVLIRDSASGKSLLIDSGNGGELLSKLKDAGAAPGSIDAILLTHSHGDHVGGLLAPDGKSPAFPNASVHIAAAELEFWKASRPEQAAACENAYEFNLIEPDEKTPVFLPNIVALDTAGHTPGHVSFLVDNRRLFAGDLLHSLPLQFARPEISASFDVDKAKAAAVRRKILERAAAENWFFAAYHIPIYPFGRVAVEGDGFRISAGANP